MTQLYKSIRIFSLNNLRTSAAVEASDLNKKTLIAVPLIKQEKCHHENDMLFSCPFKASS
jgi:hypothetical protein